MNYVLTKCIHIYIYIICFGLDTNGMNNNYITMFPKIGENITLKCGNNNMKNSEVSWKMDHKELPGRAKVMKNGDLFISSFNSSDSGIYICDLASANGYIGHAPLTKFELKPRSKSNLIFVFVKILNYI